MKIAHIGDEHIRDKGSDEIQRCLDFTVKRLQEERPDLIVSAGDMFDSQDVKAGSQAALMAIRFVSALADIAPVAMVVGTPSHDGHAPEILRHIKGKFDVFVASQPCQVYLEDGGLFDRPAGDKTPQAILTLIPTVTKQFFQTSSGIEDADREIAAEMTKLFAGFGAQAAQYPGVPHILAWHGGVSGARLPSGHVRIGMEIEVSTDQMLLSGCDIGLLGHIHSPQKLGDRFFYSGGIYPVKVDEQQCGFMIHEFGNIVGIETHYIPTPFTKTVRLAYDTTAGEPIDIPAEEINGPSVTIEITAWQDEAGMIDREGIKANMVRWGAGEVDIRINAVPRVTVRAAAVLEAETLRGEIEEMAKLRGEEIDPEILDMADRLETMPAEDVLKEGFGGCGGRVSPEGEGGGILVRFQRVAGGFLGINHVRIIPGAFRGVNVLFVGNGRGIVRGFDLPLFRHLPPQKGM